MGTGVGARTYSLIEQGQVANLVEAKPEDRRLFIEDAAGVSKYKSRKEAALRKMEATKQNLVRLNDILKEVRTQLNNISKQAKRAEQFRKITQQNQDAELTLALQGLVDFLKKKCLWGGSVPTCKISLPLFVRIWKHGSHRSTN